MTDFPSEIVETTNTLLDCVAKLLQPLHPDQRATSAILIYSSIAPDGTPRWDWKITADLDYLSVIGQVEVVKAVALNHFINTEEED